MTQQTKNSSTKVSLVNIFSLFLLCYSLYTLFTAYPALDTPGPGVTKLQLALCEQSPSRKESCKKMVVLKAKYAGTAKIHFGVGVLLFFLSLGLMRRRNFARIGIIAVLGLSVCQRIYFIFSRRPLLENSEFNQIARWKIGEQAVWILLLVFMIYKLWSPKIRAEFNSEAS